MASKRKTCNLGFDFTIYKKIAVSRAIEAFRDFASFKVRYTNKKAMVKIEYTPPDSSDIIHHEFANYVLGLTKQCL